MTPLNDNVDDNTDNFDDLDGWGDEQIDFDDTDVQAQADNHEPSQLTMDTQVPNTPAISSSLDVQQDNAAAAAAAAVADDSQCDCDDIAEQSQVDGLDPVHASALPPRTTAVSASPDRTQSEPTAEPAPVSDSSERVNITPSIPHNTDQHEGSPYDHIDSHIPPESLHDTHTVNGHLDETTAPVSVVEESVQSLEDHLESIDINENTVDVPKPPAANNPPPAHVAAPPVASLNGDDLSLKTVLESQVATIEDLRYQLDQALMERDEYVNQYDELVEKMSAIRTSIGERLKSDQEQIAKNEAQIAELEKSVSQLKTELINSSNDFDRLSKDNQALRSQLSSAQDSWDAERDTLNRKIESLQMKLADLEQTSSDWEILANEERKARTVLETRILDLEDQLRLYDEQSTSENQNKSRLEEQIAELRLQADTKSYEYAESIRNLENKLDTQKQEAAEELLAANTRTHEAQLEIEKLQQQVSKMTDLEKELKEKNALVGKLRHESVGLNEHLTQALKLIKKIRPNIDAARSLEAGAAPVNLENDNADLSFDKELISNLFLSFIQIPRGDSKRFEVLKVIATYLQWDDQKRAVAGLARMPLSMDKLPVAGAATSSATLNRFGLTGESNESIADLWTEFLERETSN
ncbi:hypothetical protein CANCADRAFT_44183 [Tortispora caseinolytica NRRL Y-17796]|uniref:GRIP domain-containing protein n=1 Tax=Tortispora caseinolytica NRRL Y-17796 TaxID=767744 RepID=A0A1E4TFI0_9ASCO|nr:hypothetical protein CANCADRAFT_44183 [Tortispora caseinolytica NRRL Y-17796]